MSLKLHKRRNTPNWYIRGTVRGIPVDESTGTSERAVAEEIRIQREAEVLQRSVHGARATATFLEAAVGYLESGGERRYLKPLIDHFGATPLVRVDQAAIDAASAKLKPTASDATRNRQIYTPVSAVLKHAAKRGLCDYPRIDRPRQPKGRIRWLRPDEAEQLIEACAPHLRPLVTVLFGTGARLSEALYLDWRDVNLTDRRVWFTDTKNGEARGVPLHQRVWLELVNLPHREGAIFRTHNGQPYARRLGGGGQIDTAFKAACRRAGIENFRPHDCRHTWATWLYGATRDLRGLMELGGWKSERMVFRYTHVNPDHLAAAINALPWENSGKHQKQSVKT
jgi:integrase